jgi:hypothetical protein
MKRLMKMRQFCYFQNKYHPFAKNGCNLIMHVQRELKNATLLSTIKLLKYDIWVKTVWKGEILVEHTWKYKVLKSFRRIIHDYQCDTQCLTNPTIAMKKSSATKACFPLISLANFYFMLNFKVSTHITFSDTNPK